MLRYALKIPSGNRLDWLHLRTTCTRIRTCGPMEKVATSYTAPGKDVLLFLSSIFSIIDKPTHHFSVIFRTRNPFQRGQPLTLAQWATFSCPSSAALLHVFQSQGHLAKQVDERSPRVCMKRGQASVARTFCTNICMQVVTMPRHLRREGNRRNWRLKG